MLDDKLYTPDEISSTLGVTKSALGKWRHYGKGPAYVKVCAKVMYRGTDVNAWLDAQRVEPTDS